MHIAIVGMGCRFPGGVHDPGEYWSFLTGKGDGLVEVPPDRWSLDSYYDPDPEAPGRMYVRKGGFLADPVWDFDPEFFGIAPREASHMDPQQRLVLEVAWEALDDAGMAGRVGGRDVGVYVGAFMGDSQVLRHLPAARTSINAHTPTSGTFTMLSNRLSYVLDLRGPSMTIDTACSSSLVAIHEAVQAVVRGECESAVAGGVNVMLHPETTIAMCKGRLLAPDGRCKAFDASADGYARGEGAGMIVLKPVDAALRDGDRIYAVIRATGSNQDGRTSGITVPNPEAQAALARRVCEAAGIEPSAIGYVEAHGTGTAVGDPIEMSALGRALGAGADRAEPLVVGSVKAGIGHLEAAAGVAGVMKAALTAFHRTIAPQAWLQELNPAIPFEELSLRVATEVEPFPAGYDEPLVAVNGFGYGGSNAHVVMGAPPAPQPVSAPRGARVLPVSGATEAATRAMAGELRALVERADDLDLVSAAAWSRRAHHQFRTAVAYRDGDDLAAQLAEVAEGGGRKVGRAVVPAGTRPVFAFSGMGPQWWRMGRDLLRADGPFARTAREIDAAFVPIAGWSILDELLHDADESRVTRTEVAQPANFLVQAALVAELEAHGVRPAAVVGHSVGEVTAAYVSGALSLRDALLVSYHRARLQATTAGTGGMLAVGLPAADVPEWIPDGANVCVAAVNGPSSVTLAGDRDALDALRARLADAGIFVRALRVEVPYHSALMDPILPELESVLGDVDPAAPSLPLYSTVTGDEVVDASWGAAYWRDNVRQPVNLVGAVGALIDGGHRVFLEVGPHPVLSGNIRELLVRAGESGACIPTLVREQDDEACVLRALGDLYVTGCLDAAPGADDATVAHVDLPAYPWQRTPMWSESAAVTRMRLGTPDTRPLLGERTDAHAPEWEIELSATRLPWLPDHIVDGHVLLPGAAYLDAALSAAAELTGRARLAIESVRFVAPLVIDEHDVPVLRLAVDESTNRFSLRSRAATAAEWTVNATGRLVDGDVEPPTVALEPEEGARTVAAEELYARLAEAGLEYGPAFRRIVEAQVGAETVVATIDATFAGDRAHLVCPTVTDAALQCVAALVAGTDAFVPTGVRAVRRFGALPETVTVVARRRPEAGLRADAVVCDPAGDVLLELSGIEFSPLSPPLPAIAELDRLFYETVWEWRDGRDESPVANELAVVVDAGTEPSARARQLAEAHPRAHLVALRPGDESAATARVAEILSGGDPALVVVVAGRWEGTVGLDPIAGLAAVARSVADADAVRGAIVTERAFRLPGDRHEPDLAHAALVGARRALLNEQPRPRWRVVDVEPEDAAGDLWAELRAGEDDADEVCLRHGSRMIPRLRKTLGSHLERFEASAAVTDPEASFEVEAPPSGRPEDAALRSCERVPPGPGEVELRIEAAGLSRTGASEGAGVVADIGADVTAVAPGDRVWVVAPDLLRRHRTLPVDGDFLCRAPTGARPEHVASLLPLVTARYGLAHAAGVTAGDTVLVLGDDLAAVQVAKALGARVIAGVAGEPHRRLALEAGADAVVSSETLGFVDEVLRMTGGRGVDVVFNSVPGEVARQSLCVAAELGRVVEVGKADIRRGGVIDLEPFDRNLSFISVDVERMLAARPEVFARVAREVVDRIDGGEYRPLPATAYGTAELADAFAALADERRPGRVVLTMDATAPVRPRRSELRVRADATYLITGGFGAFGLATARWLASRGARHLVLVGRRGATTPAAREQVRALEAAGVDVVEARADVASHEDVLALVRRVAETLPPLRGVFHAAGVVDDRPLAEIGPEPLRRVLDPKIRGALNLHAALDDVGAELDAFVLYSSVSALVGPVPQIAYAGANAALDALAAARRAQGKPALSVNWGALSGGGMAEASEEVERYLALLGVRPLAMDRATALLEECLGLGDEVVAAVVSDMDWSRYEAACPASAASSRFAEHIAAATSGGSGAAALRRELLQLPDEQRGEVLAFVLAEQLAEVLGVSADGVDVTAPLTDLGVDSLMTVELSARVHTALGVELTSLDLGRGIGLSGIADFVAARLADGAQDEPTPELRKAA